MKIKPWLKYTLLAALVILLIVAVEKCNDNKSEASRIASLLDLKTREAETFKTESGLWAAKAQVAIASLNDFKAVYGAEIEKLKKELKLKPKHIRELVEVYIEGNDTVYLEKVKDRPVLVEGFKDRSADYSYSDEWNLFEAWDDGDKIRLNYSISDSISIVFTKTGGLFRRTKYEIQALSHNPSVKILGLNAVEILERRKRFVIGPQVGITINKDFKPSPYFGVGATYNVIGF